MAHLPIIHVESISHRLTFCCKPSASRKQSSVSVEITNPILEGASYDSKEFIPDIEVILNNNTLLNLEMQILNHRNWPERSLSYLCRRFDHLTKGMKYEDCKSVIHIGFLDFAPFPECAEFYASHKLLNIKNHHLYSDKFTLNVVDLSHIELATVEDKVWGIDNWARLFKASTWEELKMIAKNDLTMTKASENLFTLNADEQAKARARAREEYIAHEQAVQQREKMYKQQLTAKNRQIAEQNALIESLRAELAAYETAAYNPQA